MHASAIPLSGLWTLGGVEAEGVMGRYGLHERPGGRERATRALWEAVKAMVRFRAEGRCEACRGTAGPFEHHHVLKRSQGGADHVWNVAYLCRTCHAATDQPYSKGRLVMSFFYAPPGFESLAATGVAEPDPGEGIAPPDDLRTPTGIRVTVQYGEDKRSIARTEFVRMIWNLQ